MVLLFVQRHCPACRAVEAAGVLAALRKAGVEVQVEDLTAGVTPLGEQYRVRSTPTWILVGEDGAAAKRRVGVATAAQLEKWAKS